jgi:glycosyltransferase involved in cell wall biosynthesis
VSRPAIAAVVITRNEEANLPRCLESVRPWASEIVVVDSGSTDRTREIARRYTDRVLVQEWLGYGPQKQFAVEQARAPWVFSIDADEEATPELAREIQGLDFAAAGYYVPRQVHYLGRWIRHGVWNPDLVLRLFRRERGRFTRDRVHESVVVEGPTARLSGPLRHYSFRDVAHHLEKLDEMTTLAALQMHERGRSVGFLRLLLQPGWEFARSYLLRQGFRDGVPGLVVAKLHAYHCFLKYAKLWELGRKRGRDA